MRALNPFQVAQWGTIGELWYPTAINADCPNCRQRGTFSTDSPTASPASATVAGAARCPRCKQLVSFVAMGCQSEAEAEPRCAWIAMHPSISDEHDRLDDFELFAPSERLVELYD